MSRQELQEKNSDIYINDTFSQRQDNISVDREITDINKTDILSDDNSSLPDLADHEGRGSELQQRKREIETSIIRILF